jgi:hypothetical protein
MGPLSRRQVRKANPTVEDGLGVGEFGHWLVWGTPLAAASRVLWNPHLAAPVPLGHVTLHEAKFSRLEEAGQAALEVAQEEDAPPKASAEDEEGLGLLLRPFARRFPAPPPIFPHPHAATLAATTRALRLTR